MNLNDIYSTMANLPIYAVSGLILLGLWASTSRANKGRIRAAVAEVESFFVYKAETAKIESWRILSPEDPYGDCEDFGLTAIRIYSGSGLMFLWNVSNMLKFRIWYVKDPTGLAHAITVCSGGAFDNHKKRAVPVSEYKDAGYRFLFPWPFPIIWLKLAVGKLAG